MKNTSLPSKIESPEEYIEARTFWSVLLHDVLLNKDIHDEILRYIFKETTYLALKGKRKPFVSLQQLENLSKETDGNPIFLCELHEISKSIRVIQEEPTDNGLQIGAWVERESSSNGYDQLVISLELTEESYEKTRAMIVYWLYEGVSKVEMEELIDDLWK